MSFEKAKAHLAKFGLEDNIMEFDVSSATVPLAAAALGCQTGQIGKTLSFLVDEKPILIVVAGDAKVDNKKFKAIFGKRPKMIAFEDVENLIGHGVGGVCPFGINEGVTVYLDDSIKRFEIIHPASGSSNSAVRLTIAQLEEASRFEKWVDVCIV